MEKAAVLPEDEVEAEGAAPGEADKLDAFTDFVDSLDLDDLEGSEGEGKE
jgi:hypothetical protein